jgi:hypothetical protein
MPSPIVTLRTKVSPYEIAHAYLMAELTKLVGHHPVVVSALGRGLADLPHTERIRLCQGLSGTYRLNFVSRYLGNPGYTWELAEVDTYSLTMPKTSPAVDKIVFSDGIDGNLGAFVGYLREYFAAWRTAHDPLSLSDFRKHGEHMHQYGIIRVEDDKLHIVDGTHRFIAQLLQPGSQDTVLAYVGRLTGESKWPADMNQIRELALIYDEKRREGTDPVSLSIFIDAVAEVVKATHDGAHAVQVMWIDYAESPEMAFAGQSVLEVAEMA